MTLQDRIVEEARSWKGTRFQDQGRLKLVGVDCVGFITEVARGAGVNIDGIPHNYVGDQDGTEMLRLLRDHMEMVDVEDINAGDIQPGDVLALTKQDLSFPDVPRHLAFVTEVTPKTIFIIHASEAGVREHRTNEHWRRRIHSVWRLKQ